MASLPIAEGVELWQGPKAVRRQNVQPRIVGLTYIARQPALAEIIVLGLELFVRRIPPLPTIEIDTRGALARLLESKSKVDRESRFAHSALML
jgi:hypothetical protein